MSQASDWAPSGSQQSSRPSLDRKRLSFDPTVNLGHVLTAVTFLAAGFAAWNALDKRVTILEVERRSSEAAQSQRDTVQDQWMREGIVVIRESIAKLERSLEEAKSWKGGAR